MSNWPIPTAEQQLAFLQQLQQLFEEGDFSSTYKYALLLALAELAVERGDDSGAPLGLPLLQIADKFAQFYWPQTAPYTLSAQADASGVLSQNRGQQAAIVRLLLDLRTNGVNTLAQARQHYSWGQTQRQIAKVVQDMPVRYLQNLTGTTVVFLYEPKVEDGNLRLLPGVAFYLRRFQGFVHQLVRTGWLEHIRSNRRNTPLIGQAGDLESFLFGTARADLSGVAKLLAPLQSHRCFFCGETLKLGAMAVDHFIPWSRYPRDTALNFVLAHASCNGDKRELLAGERHLDHWLERNRREGDEITGALQELGFLIEPEITQMVAKWAYQQAVGSAAHVWLARGQTEKISPDLMRVFV